MFSISVVSYRRFFQCRREYKKFMHITLQINTFEIKFKKQYKILFIPNLKRVVNAKHLITD